MKDARKITTPSREIGQVILLCRLDEDATARGDSPELLMLYLGERGRDRRTVPSWIGW